MATMEQVGAVVDRASEDELRRWEAEGVDVAEWQRREACHRPLSAAVAQYAELDLTNEEQVA